MTGELNTTQIKNILTSQAIGRLACLDGQQPYIVPIIYTYDGKYIYSETNDGKKLELMRKNPHVCFETDIKTGLRNWQSVVIVGTFEELSDQVAEDAREVLRDRVFPQSTHNTSYSFGHKETITIEEDGNREVVYRIKIKKLTGRFESQ